MLSRWVGSWRVSFIWFTSDVYLKMSHIPYAAAATGHCQCLHLLRWILPPICSPVWNIFVKKYFMNCYHYCFCIFSGFFHHKLQMCVVGITYFIWRFSYPSYKVTMLHPHVLCRIWNWLCGEQLPSHTSDNIKRWLLLCWQTFPLCFPNVNFFF